MNGATVFVLAILGIGIYAIAKQRGERKKAMEVMDHEETLDRVEAQSALDQQHNNDAWDNLNDTVKPRAKRTRTKRAKPTE